jgi:TctA family transporter
MFEATLSALSYLGTSAYWTAFLTGVALAATAGLLPGVSSTLLMALTVPFVVFAIEDPVVGLVLLATITGVEEMLDVLPVIVLGLPGGGNQVTFLEGNQLVQRGMAARVLGFVYAVSALGGVVGALVLALVIPIIKPFILKFSFAEIAAVGLFGVAMVAALSRGAVVKGIIAGMVGILLGTIGVHPLTGAERYTFGLLALWDGLPLIAATLGVFAMPEILDLTMTRKPLSPLNAVISSREVFRGAVEGLKRWKLIVRQSLFGVFLGAIPGVGSQVVSWLAYMFGISMSKDKGQFGKGSLDGILFAESCQSAKEGGQAIPTLALGLPGGRSWAFIVVAMLAYGIAPGPEMLGRHADVTIMIVISLILGNAALALVGLLWSGQLAKLARLPYPLIGAVIIPLTFLSAYQESRDWSGIYILLLFTPVGLLMKQFRWPRPPLILGFILGPIIENNLQSAVSVYGWFGTLTRPFTIALLLLALATAYFLARLESGDEDVTRPRATRNFAWRQESLFTLAVAAAGGFFLWKGLEFSTQASFLPVLVSTGIVFLSLIQMGMETAGIQSGEVMDIGMRSSGVEGSKRTGAVLLGLIALFLLLSAFWGLQYASIVFAVLCAAALMSTKRRWPPALAAGSIIGAMVFIVFDYLMAIIWPEAFLLTWISGLF